MRKKIIQDPTEIIFHAISFLKSRADLLKSMSTEESMQGAQGLLNTVMNVLADQHQSSSRALPSNLVTVSEDQTDDEDQQQSGMMLMRRTSDL